MEFLKRHAFLLGLVAGVVVLTVAIGLFVHFRYGMPSQDFRRRLESARRELRSLQSPTTPVYTEQLREALAERGAELRERHRALLEEIARMGAQREPLVEGLLPHSVKIELRHQFKQGYIAGIQEFMTRLDAVDPKLSAQATEEEIEEKREQVSKATMFADTTSFILGDWVNQPEAPSIEICRQAQENYWLMEDLVRIVAKLNADHLQRVPATIENAPVKELIAIRIGSREAALKNSGMKVGAGRYRRVGSKEERPASVTGRVSKPGYYMVLPWRMDVVARSNLAGELVRRIKDTESFLTVTAWRIEPITESSFATHADLLAAHVGERRKIYGPEGVVRLSIVGESLVFQLENGRVTTPQDIAGTGVELPGPAVEPGETEGTS